MLIFTGLLSAIEENFSYFFEQIKDYLISAINFENTDENSNERGSPPSNAKKLNDINSDNSGDESANSELEEDDDIDDEENENSQTGLAITRLWYLA